MAQIQFGDELENVVTREEWPLSKARETLADETIAVLGYGVQGPGQALNLRDNGFNVIVGQRKGSKTWDKALADGWVEGETLFEIEEAARRGTIIRDCSKPDSMPCNCTGATAHHPSGLSNVPPRFAIGRKIRIAAWNCRLTRRAQKFFLSTRCAR